MSNNRRKRKSSRALIPIIICGCIIYSLLKLNVPACPRIPPKSTSHRNSAYHSFDQWLESIQSKQEWKDWNEASQGSRDIHERIHECKGYEFWTDLSLLCVQCLLFLYWSQQPSSEEPGLAVVSKRQLQLATFCITSLFMSQLMLRRTTSVLFSIIDDPRTGRVVQFQLVMIQMTFYVKYVAWTLLCGQLARGFYLTLARSNYPKYWKQVPQYIGSKNLMLMTCWGVTGLTFALALAHPTLRSLVVAGQNIHHLALFSTGGYFIAKQVLSMTSTDRSYNSFVKQS